MTRTETEIGRLLRNRFQGIARIVRIESRETGRSIPDYQIRSNTADWWVELKRITTCNIGSSEYITIPWRAGQQEWLITHAKYGGNVGLIVGFQNKVYVIVNPDYMLKTYDGFSHLESLSVYSGIIYDMPRDLWEIA